MSKAPGELELVRELVNTRSLETGKDALGSRAALVAWLEGRGLVPAGTRAGRGDLARVTAVREALRALLVANAGGRLDPDAPAVLEAAARWARLSLQFRPDGGAGLQPERAGVGAGVGRLLAVAAGAMANGTWPRLKSCRSDACLWAFYDRSPNRSRTWCSMAVCGNREKVRTFRERRSV